MGRGVEFLLIAYWLSTAVRDNWLHPQGVQVWTKYLHFVLVIRTYAEEQITDHLNDTCIGVLDIVDTYESCNHNGVSLLLLGDHP